MQTGSERSAWIRRGWEDERKGWGLRLNVPRKHEAAYLLGRRRAREIATSVGWWDASREQG